MSNPSNAEILRAIGDLEGTVRAIGDKLDDHRDRMNVHSSSINLLVADQARLSTKMKLYSTAAGSMAAGIVTIFVAMAKYFTGMK